MINRPDCVEFRNKLPERPYCTDDLKRGLQIRPVAQAVERLYIQGNKPTDLCWLTYDLDTETAGLTWQDVDAPAPNIMILNKANGHGHYLYGLNKPIFRQQEFRSSRPFRYASAVDLAMTELLGADPGYSKLIQKNPLRPDFWEVLIPEGNLYDLGDLAEYLDLRYMDLRRKVPPIGLGRNCILFDTGRRSAYRLIRRPWLNYETWEYCVRQICLEINEEFPVPLPHSEVRATARSIAKWVWRNMGQEGFRAWGDNRRKRSMSTRKEKALALAEKVFSIRADNPGMKQAEIARLCDVSQPRVSQVLKAGNPLSSDITDLYFHGSGAE